MDEEYCPVLLTINDIDHLCMKHKHNDPWHICESGVVWAVDVDDPEEMIFLERYSQN